MYSSDLEIGLQRQHFNTHQVKVINEFYSCNLTNLVSYYCFIIIFIYPNILTLKAELEFQNLYLIFVYCNSCIHN